MNIVKRKLRSQNGASMILAMVFMLFCLFVGGSVLAAAAENGYRVEHLSDQQQYLDERSAALLISNQLKTEQSKPLKLIITQMQTAIQPVLVQNGGVVVNDPTRSPTSSLSISIQGPELSTITPLQQIAVETAVWRYLKEAGITSINSAVILYNDSLFDPLMDYDLTSSKPISGTIHIQGERSDGVGGSSGTIADFDATFTCCDGANLYDFTVDFDNLTHSTQMTVVMDGYSGHKDSITTTTIGPDGTDYSRYTTVSTQTAISWENPVIEKGGT